MKRIKLLLPITIIALVISISSCGFGDSNSKKLSLAKETITAFINADKAIPKTDIEVLSVSLVDDSTYKAVHTFTNTILKREMRIERMYFLVSDLHKCKKKKDLNVEMKSDGVWVATKK